MEILASIFVTLVLIIDSFLPKASLAKNLGVLPEENPSVLSAMDNKPATATTTATVSVRKEEGELNGKTVQERLEFRNQLQEIKNEKKRQVTEKIVENIEKNNESWMNHLTETLNRLSAILSKIEIRANELKAQGKDTFLLGEKINDAKDLISSAQEAVNTQREKVYTFDVGEEENLGENVSSVVKSFRSDVQTVFDAVKLARQTVRDALQILKELTEENN